MVSAVTQVVGRNILSDQKRMYLFILSAQDFKQHGKKPAACGKKYCVPYCIFETYLQVQIR